MGCRRKSVIRIFYSNVKKIEAVTMVTTLTMPFFTADAEIKREKKKRILHVLLDLLNEFRKPTKC